MESQPQNPEFRNNPENFHDYTVFYLSIFVYIAIKAKLKYYHKTRVFLI